ncbi:ATP-binding protein [Methylobacterium sp. BTF04]|uniref:ATP-binding protein n=1 Tax=Methylobacterium sp. BTF04 TaxID=2708300 RepID=UPI0032B21425
MTEASQVAEVRRRATSIATNLGFDETANGRVAIVATELATNLVKYGTSGEILVGTFEDDTGTGVELVSLDRGPGLADLGEALRDGHSTGGSPGLGLGSIRRQSQAFDIASWPGRGTAILARIEAVPRTASACSRFGAVAVPMRGEVVNGDGYCIRSQGSAWTLIVADGLGHGPHAAKASDEAVRLFRSREHDAPGEILATAHAGMRHTRGAAVSIARYIPERGVVVFAGIGNVMGGVVTGLETKRMVSLPGTAGHVARHIREFEYPFADDSLFVMCSDGIATGWSLDAYAGLKGAHPSLIAGILYRDFSRGRDDATVVVARGVAP